MESYEFVNLSDSSRLYEIQKYLVPGRVKYNTYYNDYLPYINLWKFIVNIFEDDYKANLIYSKTFETEEEAQDFITRVSCGRVIFDKN